MQHDASCCLESVDKVSNLKMMMGGCAGKE